MEDTLETNGFGDEDLNLINFATFLTRELRAASPIRTGNMQRSIELVSITNGVIYIHIPVEYASYVNEQKKHKNWINKVIATCTRAYSQNNVEFKFENVNVNILYGGD